MNIFETINLIAQKQSCVGQGAILDTADIVRRRMLEVTEFDHCNFFEALAKVDRRGWTERGLQAENDLVHSIDLALVSAEWLRRRGLDVEAGVMQALVHEAGEAGPQGAGDTRPGEKSLEQQIGTEREAVRALNILCGGDVLLDPWEQYIANAIPEAQIVCQLDKIVAIREAARRGVWEEFYEYCMSKKTFSDEEIRETAKSYGKMYA